MNDIAVINLNFRRMRGTYAIRFTFSHWPGVKKLTKRFLYNDVIFLPTGMGALRGYGFAVVATAGGVPSVGKALCVPCEHIVNTVV